MVYMFLSALALLCLCTGFHYSYCRHGIEECYFGLYKGIMEEGVVVASSGGGYLGLPLFSLSRLRYLLDDYFATNLSPYCRTYTFSVTDKSGSTSPNVRTVRVTFAAKIDDLNTISREAIFTIWRTSQ